MRDCVKIHPKMVLMRDISMIKDGDRLFYELGYKKDGDNPLYNGNWISTGEFIEVEDVRDMLEKDVLMGNIEYLNHHNFMLILKDNN